MPKQPVAANAPKKDVPPADHTKIGTQVDTIDVRISYQIIHLFSEGLYQSPHKAIEELVANAFDAGALHVHVVMSPDLSAPDATIAVIDDGAGMDKAGLHQLWVIGDSPKRRNTYVSPRGRKQIGKFGIGKLATYVLARSLTHICKRGKDYFATTMDYGKIPTGEGGGIYARRGVKIPLRQLTKKEAQAAVAPWTTGSKDGYKALRLFGADEPDSWTVAIMSDLKDMALELRRGTLQWVLRTAMPLRDDFGLFLDGDAVKPSKIKARRLGHWELGTDVSELPQPAPDDLEVIELKTEGATVGPRKGLVNSKLGVVTGYYEVFEDPIVGAKSDEIERSNGFFVYVHGRLVNIADAGFGINRNLLRHGTFSRFRMVAQVDKLDESLRSSRETFRDDTVVVETRNLLHGAFNHARVELEKAEAARTPQARLTHRIGDTPGSLARWPIVDLAEAALTGSYAPRYVRVPGGLSRDGQTEFLASLRERAEDSASFVTDVRVEDRAVDAPLALFDAESGILVVNSLHPFVAAFRDSFEDGPSQQPLQLLAMAEVLLEAHLFKEGVDQERIHDALDRRDEVLRFFARSSGRRTASAIAEALEDAASDKHQLELELVEAFDCLGFEAVHTGGKSGEPDGVASARLAAQQDGTARAYKVSLEAKSKEAPGKKVSAKGVGISTVARHRKDKECDHAVVVGPDFPTSKGDDSALQKEMANDKAQTGKTITLIRISDFARLVRNSPLRRLGLAELRKLFQSCSMPEESQKWIDELLKAPPTTPPFKPILDAIWKLQADAPAETVDYGSIATELRTTHKELALSKADIAGHCRALSQFVPGLVIFRKASVELNQKPEAIIEAVRNAWSLYRDDERPRVGV